MGCSVKKRERHRCEITPMRVQILKRDRMIGTGERVLSRYERIAFWKSLFAPQGQQLAAFVFPGHPLLAACIDLTLKRNRDLLRRVR